MNTKKQNRSRKPSPTRELVGVDVPRLVRLEVYCETGWCGWAGDYDETTWSLKDELTGQIVECSGEDPNGERCCPHCLLTNLMDTDGWDDDQLPKRAFRLPNVSEHPTAPPAPL